MANTKISALTSATTPLAGAETLPVVQSGATKQVSVANLTAGRTVAASSFLAPSIGADTGSSLSLQSNGATKATLDTSGNLGLNIVPSAWATTTNALEFYSGALYSLTNGNAIRLMQNAYQGTGGFVYSQTKASAYYQLNQGVHYWYTAPSGTAGTTVTFSLGMILNNSNNLGVGTSAPNFRIQSTGGDIFATDGTYAGPNTLIGSGVTSDSANSGTAPGLDMRRWTGSSLIHGVGRIGTDSTGAINFYNDSKSTNTPATTKKLVLDINGNLIPQVAGTGINFTANTPQAGMTSQLLNWYEEGTWTPNQGAGLTVVGTFSSSGKYTRIGRQITVSGTVSGGTTVAIASAGVITTNLPFTVGTTGHGGVVNATVTASAVVICTGTSLTSSGAIASTTSVTFTAVYII